MINILLKSLLLASSMFFGFTSKAQETYLQSGYTTLIIHSTTKITPTILMANPLQDITPKEVVAVNDSVYLASFYTFGPTSIRLHLFNKNYPFVVLPNRTSTITVEQRESQAFDLQYSGPFKGIFSESQSIYNLTGEGYYKHRSDPKVYISAVDYKDAILERYDKVIEEAKQQIDSELAKTYFANSFRMFMLSPLFDYERRIIMNNLNAGLDSLEATKHIPPRNLSYYNGIIDSRLADTTSLLSAAYYTLLSAMAKDSLLGLPYIRDENIDRYKAKLIEAFDPIFDSRDNLFYDMVIANAFIDQITQGVSLSDSQILDIIDYFDNPEIPNYILRINETSSFIKKQSTGKFYLPFSDDDSVMRSILAGLKNKVVVVDFWATWCGPCIEAFSESKAVKETFSGKDVAFVYIADETSNVSKWHEYVSVLGGEHYYISRKQMLALQDEFDFSSIPTYLIYNKNGEFVQKNIGYMGNSELTKIIEGLLD